MPMNFDARALRELEVLVRRMSAPEAERFCDGLLRASVAAQRVFRERHPAEWFAFNKRVDEAGIDA
jgi:hypothetical protein